MLLALIIAPISIAFYALHFNTVAAILGWLCILILTFALINKPWAILGGIIITTLIRFYLHIKSFFLGVGISAAFATFGLFVLSLIVPLILMTCGFISSALDSSSDNTPASTPRPTPRTIDVEASTSIHCIHCNYPLSEDMDFCPNCGKPTSIKEFES